MKKLYFKPKIHLCFPLSATYSFVSSSYRMNLWRYCKYTCFMLDIRSWIDETVKIRFLFLFQHVKLQYHIILDSVPSINWICSIFCPPS